ncbi:MAG: GNAT family N-acetyltransferase [Pseudomonadota bacterium]
MFEDYPRETIIKDGTVVLMRPVVGEDEERLKLFFSRIPETERWFLRDDLTDPEVMHRWLVDLDFNRIVPMVAVRADDESIIANVRMYRRAAECMRHIAHVRITVHPDYRHQRIGTWMLLDAVKLCMDLGIEKLVAEFVSEVEQAAIAAAYKLDFFPQATLKDYVKNRQGRYYDLIIMVKNIHKDWSDF